MNINTKSSYQIVNLEPIYDSRKSFYGKAKVIYDHDHDYIILRSYDTDVCRIENNRTGWKFRRLWEGYSATTMRHVNDFIYQYCPFKYAVSHGGKKWWDSLKVGE